MTKQQVLEVQEGIWIDKQWLHSAGLGSRLQVVVQPGEIRLRAAPTEGEPPEPSEAGWRVFRALGQDAPPGRLPNAAVEHDRYLYGKDV
jgi:hypothetical protein